MSLWDDWGAPVLSGLPFVLNWLLGQFPAWGTAYLAARAVKWRNFSEFMTAAVLVYLAFSIALPASAGICGILSPGAVIVDGWMLFAAAVYIFRNHKNPLPRVGTSTGAAVLTVFVLSVSLSQFRINSFLAPVGTDGLIYHLYFPAVWLRDGNIARIIQPGYPTCAYPCNGELLYCFNMIAGDFFAKQMQFVPLWGGFFAMCAGLRALGFRPVPSAAAAGCALLCGLAVNNALVADTDTMTGGFILIGAGLLAVTLRRGGLPAAAMAGLAWGTAAGVKLLGTMLVPVLSAGLIIPAWLLLKQRRRELLFFTAALVLSAVPWFIANWVTAGNPVFPCRVGCLFANYMEIPVSHIGFGADGWNFLVGNGPDKLSVPGAVLPLFSALAGAVLTALRRKRIFLNTAMPLLLTALLAALALQLAVYPKHTQPRQIIPLALLAAGFIAFPVELAGLPWRGRRRGAVECLAGFAAVLAVSCPQFNYPRFAPHIAAVLGLLAVFAAVFRRGGAAARIIAVPAALLLLLDISRCFSVCNANAPEARRLFISPAHEEVRAVLDAADPSGAGLTLACSGAFYYQYMGRNLNNRIISIPVNAAGTLEPWKFRSFDEISAPGPVSEWISRVLASGAAYLITDPGSAVWSQTEYDWAKEHPERFELVFSSSGVSLFRIIPGA